ncbi:MAG: OsmC family protein [Pyrinomonadaceae bacterium]
MPASTLNASVHYAGDQLFIGTPSSGHAQIIDTKGDRKLAPTPVELLLVGLATCAGAEVVSILEKKRQVISGYHIEITATQADDHPRRFLTFHINHIVHGRTLSEKAVADAISLAEAKYCPIAATLRPTAEIASSFEVVAGDSAKR